VESHRCRRAETIAGQRVGGTEPGGLFFEQAQTAIDVCLKFVSSSRKVSVISG
jgi:hypothetical protein